MREVLRCAIGYEEYKWDLVILLLDKGYSVRYYSVISYGGYIFRYLKSYRFEMYPPICALFEIPVLHPNQWCIFKL